MEGTTKSGRAFVVIFLQRAVLHWGENCAESTKKGAIFILPETAEQKAAC